MKMGQIEMEGVFSPQTRMRAVYSYIKKEKGYKETFTTHIHTPKERGEKYLYLEKMNYGDINHILVATIFLF